MYTCLSLSLSKPSSTSANSVLLEHDCYVKFDLRGQRPSKLEGTVRRTDHSFEPCMPAKLSISHGLTFSFISYPQPQFWLEFPYLGGLVCFSCQDRRAPHVYHILSVSPCRTHCQELTCKEHFLTPCLVTLGLWCKYIKTQSIKQSVFFYGTLLHYLQLLFSSHIFCKWIRLQMFICRFVPFLTFSLHKCITTL